MNLRIPYLDFCVIALGTSLLASPVSADPRVETEPNNTCATAQVLAVAQIPFSLVGNLSDGNGDSGVDFYRVRLNPWQPLRVDLEGAESGNGTLDDPYLGLFDGSCQRLQQNDDYAGLDSRLTFKAPQDGVVVLAAGSCCDDDFRGEGGSRGTYLLTLSPQPPVLEGITGRIIDAVHWTPIAGDSHTWANVSLVTPNDNWIADTQVGPDGRFTITQDNDGRWLEAGTYRVVAYAEGYSDGRSEPFHAPAGDIWDIGDVRLIPAPVSFTNLEVCESVPPEGGRCRISMRVVSNRYHDLRVEPWLIVQGGINSPAGDTIYELRPKGKQIVKLPALKSRTVRFVLKIPGPSLRDIWLDVTGWAAKAGTSRLHTLRQDGLINIYNDGEKYVVESQHD